MAKLLIQSDGGTQEVTLASRNTLGRHPDNSIQILDRIVSKNHAKIIKQRNGEYKFIDLQSLNGTFKEGHRVDELILADGDEITMGTTTLRFKKEKTKTGNFSVAEGNVDSLIRGKITMGPGEFLPVENVTDEEALRRDYERLRVSNAFAASIAGQLDLEQLLPKILEAAFSIISADRGAILLVDETGSLVPHFVKTKKAGQEKNISLSKTVLSEVMSNKAAVLSSDASVDDRFAGAQSIIMQGIRSTMTVPLLIREELVGIMHLDSLVATTTFTTKDLQICSSMAAQAAVAIQNARLAKRIESEAAMRAQISRLIPPSVVDQVMAGQLTIEKGGRSSEITMLYSDIRGFTAMSERKTAEDVVATLNAYFEIMVEVLFQFGGTLDKFVGDEIIGLFGAPIEIENAPLRAVSCALAMMRELEKFNASRATVGLEPLTIGIGVNTGTVITGAIGSTRALQYTAIGDAMNVASRLVSVAKPGEIIISESTMSHVNSDIDAEELEPVTVKGKTNALRIFKVRGAQAFGEPTVFSD